jgi:hypothetical protein
MLKICSIQILLISDAIRDVYADLLCDAQKQAGCLAANQQREIDAKNGGLLRL